MDYRIKVKDGDEVKAGDELTAGSKNPADVLAILGSEAVRNYIITEVQKVYRLQGVDVNDKHIEVITRQMLRKVKIEDPGSSYLLPGTLVDRHEIDEINAQIQEEIDAGDTSARLITTSPVIQGITKASSSSESFLSAASFQETTRALTDAAIKGKSDHLLGLKENVIIGKLLPAGTGMQVYNNVEVVYKRYLHRACGSVTRASAGDCCIRNRKHSLILSQLCCKAANHAWFAAFYFYNYK